MPPTPVLAPGQRELKISLANRTDLQDVESLVKACTRHMDSQGIPQWDEVYPNREVLERDIAQHSLFVAVDDGNIIGAMALNTDQEPEYAEVPWMYSGETVLVVHRLCVHPDSQGKGVATLLMDFAERRASRGGYGAIRLDAFARNLAAVALYENRGYRNAGTVMFRKGRFYCFEKETLKEDTPNQTLLRDSANRERER